MSDKPKKKRPAGAEYIDDKGTSGDDTAYDADADSKIKGAEQQFDPEANADDVNIGLPDDDTLENEDSLPEYADPRDGEDYQGGPEDKAATDEDTGDDDDEGDDDPLADVQYESYGITKEQAEALHQQGRLDETLNMMDQRLLQAGQGFPPQPMPPGPPMPQQWPQQQMPPGMSPPMQGVPPQQQMPPTPQQVQYQLELNPEDYTPEFVEQMQKMEAAYQARMARMEQALVNMAFQSQQSAQEAAMERFDTWVGGLPDEYKTEFGQGPIEGLNPQGMEVWNRQRVYDTYQALEAGYARQGLPSPGEVALRERALRMVAKAPQEAAREQVRKEVSDLAGHITKRPTQRRGRDHRSPEQRAIARAEKKLKAVGG